MATQSIKLIIAGLTFQFDIDRAKEEMYHLAEKEVNNYFASIRQKNFREWDEQHYIAMTALRFAISTVDMRRATELSSDDLKRIEAVDAKLDAYLNTLNK